MSDNKQRVSLEDIVSLCKRRGFVFQGSEIYGGLAGTWDYGPLGVTLKKNLMDLWWKTFVEDRDDIFGVDAAILMNKKVWESSGHVDTFTDPLVECSECKSRFRVDKLIDSVEFSAYLLLLKEQFTKKYQSIGVDSVLEAQKKHGITSDQRAKYKNVIEDISKNLEDVDESLHDARVAILNAQRNNEKLAEKYEGVLVRDFLNHSKSCPVCGKSTYDEPKLFNMMFETRIGPLSDTVAVIAPFDVKAGERFILGPKDLSRGTDTVYLRPETAQGIFTNFRNVVDTLYPDVPFGIAQTGKAFRNEISPRDFVFRSREFNQMEIEYFVREDDWKESFEKWRTDISGFLEEAGVDSSKLSELDVPNDDLAHYSKRTIDYEFDYPHGKDELLGLAYRTDFDLTNIQKGSGKKMEYRPKDGSDPFIPHVIEPSFGVERLIMAVLVSAYSEDVQNGEKRIFLKLPSGIAPVKYCVSPLLKNKPELVEKAREVYNELKKNNAVMWDDNGNIGKRYRRQDEIGTPYCIVIDFDTLEDGTVTVRDRDTTKQKRVKIEELV